MTALKRAIERIGEDAGMTFLEVLVVLGIVALAMAVAMPKIRMPAVRGVTLASSEIAAELRALRARAVSRNQPASLRIDAQTKSIASDINTKLRQLPSGIDLTLTAAKAYVRNASNAAIVFFADGSSTGGFLVLKSGAEEATISIDWLSGRVDVERGSS